MPVPRVAVVILNWNGKNLLEKFLPSVLNSTYQNLEVVVADNGSTDQSVQLLETSFPTVKRIIIATNKGYAAGYNEALQQVQADYYVLLNSDVEVSPSWIEPVIDLMEKDLSIAACQPKILSYNHKSSFEYAGACGGWIDWFGYPFAKGRVLDYCEQDTNQYAKPSPVFWASGASLFVRAKDFHDCDGLDADFFAHQEEIDLCWRLQLRGKKIFSCPSAVVWHVGGSTLPTGNSQKTFLNYRNNLSMLVKNLPIGKLLLVLPIRFLLDALAAYKGLFSGDPGYWWAVARAHFALMERLPNLIRKRAQQNLNKPLAGVYSGSILWQYYFKKKRRFSEIVAKES